MSYLVITEAFTHFIFLMSFFAFLLHRIHRAKFIRSNKMRNLQKWMMITQIASLALFALCIMIPVCGVFSVISFGSREIVRQPYTLIFLASPVTILCPALCILQILMMKPYREAVFALLFCKRKPLPSVKWASFRSRLIFFE
ncbi:unnamed protein product [Caenorhabditis auriculariae]|uniref:Uncharacterized protein n=1 Tax=Caenorhabditis auriculariae TaxID=2777116 RepID=A0A8S1HS36_9PELO|nr:unnamed protein product [Caenorhabditis auriculariae]